ncbi:hypothetical protein GDO78_016683 [Eleutherodactylus coqui]|uniref:Uncharacterized protein n=1 Tax=Eleutherodactylus coqui TaxID=57060 RepID=A0A8J6BM69_ELECQ|nr:hypothetical protein GDO78_016683 [Eleutherodactylus coqui]
MLSMKRSYCCAPSLVPGQDTLKFFIATTDTHKKQKDSSEAQVNMGQVSKAQKSYVVHHWRSLWQSPMTDVHSGSQYCIQH